MRRTSRLPVRFPVGTKYVVEGRGQFVSRYVEFPDGRRVQLEARKALVCPAALSLDISIVPDLTATAPTSAPASTPKTAPKPAKPRKVTRRVRATVSAA
jgi:hypothetical protein